MSILSPKQLADEAREALRKDTRSSEERIADLIRAGFINAKGEVTRLLGGDVEPEAAEHGGPPVATNGSR